jgi:hypothetical protein
MVGDGAFDFRLRPQHRRRVIVDERLVAGVLHADVVGDAPVVEDGPAQGGTAERLEALAREELGGILRVEVDRADEREVRKQVGPRDADLRALRGEHPLAPSHVGPAAQQIRRQAHGDRCGRSRDPRARPAEELLDPARRRADEGRERRRLGVDRGLEGRDLRLRVVQERRRLRGIDVADRAFRRTTARDRVVPPLQLDVAAGDVELFLSRADPDVVGRHFSQDTRTSSPASAASTRRPPTRCRAGTC